jgi:hypothetical protein
MYKNLEWSGVLFYTAEGDIDSIGNMKFKLVDFILQDIGTSGHTQFENDEELIDLYMEKPHLRRCRMGLMHSHNTMPTFFSPEDWEELEDNSTGTSYYLSLIVNNEFSAKCKIAFQGKQTKKSSVKQTIKLDSGEYKVVDAEEEVEELCLFTADVKINIPELESLDADLARFRKRDAAREAAREAMRDRQSGVGGLGGVKQTGGLAWNPSRKPGFNEKGKPEKTSGKYNVSPRQKSIHFTPPEETQPVTPQEFTAFTIKLLTMDNLFEGTIKEAIDQVEKTLGDSGHMEMYQAYLVDNIENLYENHFNVIMTTDEYLVVLEHLVKEIEPYKTERFIGKVLEMIGAEITLAKQAIEKEEYKSNFDPDDDYNDSIVWGRREFTD